MSHNRGVAVALLFIAYVAATRGQNLDLLQPIVRSTPGGDRGYFGYSAVLHKTNDAPAPFRDALENTR